MGEICPLALSRHLRDDLARAFPDSDPELFAGNRMWPPDAKPGLVAAVQLTRTLLKKFVASENADAADIALREFEDCNAVCNRSTALVSEQYSELEALALGEMERKLYDLLSWGNMLSEDLWTEENILAGASFGPGASVGAYGDSLLEKISMSAPTCTNRFQAHLYTRWITESPLGQAALERAIKVYGDFVVVDGGVTTTVLKEQRKRRTIETQPSAAMLVQKGIASVLEHVLRSRLGIDLSHQPFRNARLAKEGSITGDLATGDLTNASSLIALAYCRRFIPQEVLWWLLMARCPKTTLPDGRKITLHMMATMGNGFCFPLQTLIFSAIVLGCYSALDIEPVNPGSSQERPDGNWGVFGDDIVCEAEAWPLVSRVLTLCGFKPNMEKSFHEGHFRESCGADYFHGLNVRGVYIRRLETPQDRISAANRLIRWSCQHTLPLPGTVAYLLEGLHEIPLVPLFEADDAGLKLPLAYVQCAPKTTLARCEATGSFVYKAYVRTQHKTKLTEKVIPSQGSKRPSDRGATDNKGLNPPIVVEEQLRDAIIDCQYARKGFLDIHVEAVLVAALAGTLRNEELTFRLRESEVPRYRKRWRYGPGWDSMPASDVDKLGSDGMKNVVNPHFIAECLGKHSDIDLQRDVPVERIYRGKPTHKQSHWSTLASTLVKEVELPELTEGSTWAKTIPWVQLSWTEGKGVTHPLQMFKRLGIIREARASRKPRS